jgi:NAD(P)-dependent dehydrogenase (short-subunit alcohol dehydrogenase family)
MTGMAENELALLFGVGPGLGSAVAHRCARGGMAVAVSARDPVRIEGMLGELAAAGAADARAFGCDVSSERFVEETFREVVEQMGVPRLVVFNAGAFVRQSITETDADEFERCWRVGCMGGFLVGRAAARDMLAAPPDPSGKRGTIIFTGATASLRGGAGFHNLAVGKFGLRALAQSMARELGPQGIHVAHAIVDGQIRAEHRGQAYSEAQRGQDALLHPEAIAETYWQLHQQHRSAWTHEIDLRPFCEPF